MRNRAQPRRPNGAVEMAVRSVRIAEDSWERAKRRAAQEGYTVSNVTAQFIEGYGLGYINLPQVKIDYKSTRAKIERRAPAPVEPADDTEIEATP